MVQGSGKFSGLNISGLKKCQNYQKDLTPKQQVTVVLEIHKHK